jgi:ABC-2 type transport system ATP-binding protein
VLDEPMAGMDPAMRQTTRELLRDRRRRGRTTVLSSHSLGDVEDLADEVLILHRGEVVFAGPTTGPPTPGVRRSRVEVAGLDSGAAQGIAREHGVEVAAAGAPGAWRLEDVPQQRVNAVLTAVVSAGGQVVAVTPVGGRLEEVFFAVTADAAGGGRDRGRDA